MLPIEEGCRAVAIRSAAGNEGKEFVVGKFLGKVMGWRGNDRWEIDQHVPGFKGNSTNSYRESYLMRIDGNNELFEQEREKEKVT